MLTTPTITNGIAQCLRDETASSHAAAGSGCGTAWSTTGALLVTGASADTAFPHAMVELVPSNADTGTNSPASPAITSATPTSTLRSRLFTAGR